MDFSDPGMNAALSDWASDADLYIRAQGHNIKFEEHLDRARVDEFEATVTGTVADAEDLKARLSDFVSTYVEVSGANVPLTFKALNAGASCTSLAEEQKLVRVENITRQIENQGLTFVALERSFHSADPALAAGFDLFLDNWNDARDNRPAFVAFKDQLLEEIAEPDWPHKLRDCLGLAHFNTAAGGAPMSVALVEYTIEDVANEAAGVPDIAHPFCIPTFLDHKPYHQFFPTPQELPHGVPMALFQVASNEDLISEVLHSRITYARHHVVKLGQITSDGPVMDLKKLRDHHLVALQLETRRYDYGEEL